MSDLLKQAKEHTHFLIEEICLANGQYVKLGVADKMLVNKSIEQDIARFRPEELAACMEQDKPSMLYQIASEHAKRYFGR